MKRREVTIEVAVARHTSSGSGTWSWYRDEEHWISERFDWSQPRDYRTYLWLAASEALRAHNGMCVTFISEDEEFVANVQRNTKPVASERKRLKRVQYNLAYAANRQMFTGNLDDPSHARAKATALEETGERGPSRAWTQGGVVDVNGVATSIVFSDGSHDCHLVGGWAYYGGAGDTSGSGRVLARSALMCELVAATKAIESVQTPRGVVVIDSKEVLEIAEGRSVKGGCHMQQLATRLQAVYMVHHHRIELRRVYGHSGVIGNQIADRMAGAARKGNRYAHPVD